MNPIHFDLTLLIQVISIGLVIGFVYLINHGFTLMKERERREKDMSE